MWLCTCHLQVIPNAYIERYPIAKSKGGLLIETTSSNISSTIAMAFATIVLNQILNVGNSTIDFGYTNL